jgi:hypothetical protein
MVIENIITPLKKKHSAAENFIVIQTGKILFKMSISKIQPAITSRPVMETKIAKPFESSLFRIGFLKNS